MSIATTIFHIQGRAPEAVERALEQVFEREERSRVLRVEGTYSAVLARAADPALEASYRYLILRPKADSGWTPLLELGNRTVGLDQELSRLLGGATVFTIFVYGEAVSGYRVTRDGAQIDSYLSDPTYFSAQSGEDADTDSPEVAGEAPDVGLITDPETERGHPERFADLMPAGTQPDDFARVVLRPGWWEEHESGGTPEASESEESDLVDEVDRMRCIALGLELWGPAEYPFTAELEDVPNKDAGPALALAFA